MTQIETELRAILTQYGLRKSYVNDLASSLSAWHLRHALASCATTAPEDDLGARYGGQWGGVDVGDVHHRQPLGAASNRRSS